ncbi:MAG: DinB family protein [Acidobacteriota bacterium]|nr:DinB family protein [Acidobacteriota bacterium]
MNRRDLETLLLTLESTPFLLARAAQAMCPSEVSRKPADGGFSFLENIWHLADLEREAYGVRIQRILSEDEPTLSNFDGDRIARERQYQERDVAAGLSAFSAARRRNVELLRHREAGDWNRAGVQDGVGTVTLSDVPKMMAEHDRSHTSDVAKLLDEFSEGDCPPAETRPRSISAWA